MAEATSNPLLVVLAAQFVVTLIVLGFFRGQVITINDARNREPQSPLGEHMADEKAHEPMRDVMWEKIDRRLAEIESLIHRQESEHARERAEYRDMVDSVLAQNAQLLEQLKACMAGQQLARPIAPMISPRG